MVLAQLLLLKGHEEPDSSFFLEAGIGEAARVACGPIDYGYTRVSSQSCQTRTLGVHASKQQGHARSLARSSLFNNSLAAGALAVSDCPDRLKVASFKDAQRTD